jgi:hypothetical protein
LNLIRTGEPVAMAAVAAILGGEDSLGQEAAEKVVEDLKFDLQVLNAALKKLDADWDFTATITPLLSNQGPPLALAPKLKRQIERMTELRDEFHSVKNSPLTVIEHSKKVPRSQLFNLKI